MKIDPTHYSEQNIKDLLTNTPPEIKRIIALAYGSGARVSELNQITKEDIREKNGYLEISCKVLKKKKKNEKNEKRLALIRLDETYLIEPIKELIELTPTHTPLIKYDRLKIYRLLKKYAKINPHGFRAIRATHLAQKGYTAHQLKHFFGWSSVAPSDYYVRLNTNDLRY